jgi:N-acetylmuramoyl-L-alanine amidase
MLACKDLRFIGTALFLSFAFTPLSAQSTSCSGTPITLGFDGLADLATNLNAFGVSFTGATVLSCGGSLNCVQFPPFSGRNVIYDSGNGVITATFDPSTTGPVCMVSARITGNKNITMTAYDVKNNVLGMAQTGGPNYVGSGGTPNLLLSIAATNAPIATVTFHDSGNTYTVDDFTFIGDPHVVVIDPGHGLLRDLDHTTLHYQRPPSPTFGLHEDDLTLTISQAAGDQIDTDGYTVYLTRETSLAPIAALGHAGDGCGAGNAVPYDYCNDDLILRVEMTRQIDLDSMHNAVLVSVHTNGNSNHLVNGTEAFYCRVADLPLAQDLSSGISSLGITLGVGALGLHGSPNIQDCNRSGLIKDLSMGTAVPNSLIEVAYHSNSLGSGATDEDQLVNSVFKTNAGQKIAAAIEQFILNVLDKK